jgi:hypothetical protein
VRADESELAQAGLEQPCQAHSSLEQSALRLAVPPQLLAQELAP